MVARRKSNGLQRVGVVVVLLLIAVGSVVAFQANVFGIINSKKAVRYDEVFLEDIAMTGSVKVADLNLSGKEVKTINYGVLKHRKDFPSMHVVLNMEDKFAPIKVDRKTRLELTMAFETGKDSEIQCWSRVVPRSRLVAQMVQTMDRAANEYARIKKLQGKDKRIKKLYI